MAVEDHSSLTKIGTQEQPYIIGVAGGSGAGKTTFSKALQALVGTDRSEIISLDSYYIDQSHCYTGEGSVNFDHPQALELTLLTQHLKTLKAGGAVDIPNYDFATHRRLPDTRRVVAQPVIILEGILILQNEAVRSQLDYAAFINTTTKIRHKRRLVRDVRERGASADGVRTDVVSFVEPMHIKFVEPSSKFANWQGSGEEEISKLIVDFSNQHQIDYQTTAQQKVN